MKYICYPLFITFVYWQITGCIKDNDTEYTPPQFKSDSKVPPKADAGPDSITVSNVDYFSLTGSASAENSIRSIIWAKIAGPSNYNMLTPKSHTTEVRDVVNGNYKFEFAVTDHAGLVGKDTIIVNVEQPNTTREVYFRNLEWFCVLECQLEITGMHNYISPGSFFKVYIQRDNSNFWERIYSSGYWYDNDTLFVYMLGDGSFDTPDIRIDY